MIYKVYELDQKTMSVAQFVEEIKSIPYWKILVEMNEITLEELKEKYMDKTVFLYNDPKDFGHDYEGISESFDRLFVEVIL